MKKLLSAVLTIIVVASIVYVPYRLSVRLYRLGLPNKTEGAVWYIVLSIGYYVVNWFIGLTIVSLAAGVLIFVLLVGKFMQYLTKDTYDEILTTLGGKKWRRCLQQSWH